jgi:hypothetical protein
LCGAGALARLIKLPCICCDFLDFLPWQWLNNSVEVRVGIRVKRRVLIAIGIDHESFRSRNKKKTLYSISIFQIYCAFPVRLMAQVIVVS